MKHLSQKSIGILLASFFFLPNLAFSQVEDCLDYSETPQFVARFFTGPSEQTRKIIPFESTLFCIGSYGLKALDISAPWTPVLANSIAGDWDSGLIQDDLLVLHNQTTLQIFDLSTFILLSTIPGEEITSVALDSGRMAMHDDYTIKLYDISDPTNPIQSSSYYPIGAMKSSFLFQDDYLVFTRMRSAGIHAVGSSMMCFDISNTSHLVLTDKKLAKPFVLNSIGIWGMIQHEGVNLVLWGELDDHSFFDPDISFIAQFDINAMGRITGLEDSMVSIGAGWIEDVSPYSDGLFVQHYYFLRLWGPTTHVTLGLLNPQGIQAESKTLIVKADKRVFVPGLPFLAAFNEEGPVRWFFLGSQGEPITISNNSQYDRSLVSFSGNRAVTSALYSSGDWSECYLRSYILENGLIEFVGSNRTEYNYFRNISIVNDWIFCTKYSTVFRTDFNQSYDPVSLESQVGPVSCILGVGTHLLTVSSSNNISFYYPDADGNLSQTGPYYHSPGTHALVNGFVYLNSGRKIIDLSDPQNPVQIAQPQISGEYLAHDASSMLTREPGTSIFRYDISDPLDPVLVGSVEDFLGESTISISGDIIYRTAGQEGLSVYRWGGSTAPEYLGGLLLGNVVQSHVTSSGLMVNVGDTMELIPLDCDDPLPVFLRDFSCTQKAGTVEINWSWSGEESMGHQFRVLCQANGHSEIVDEVPTSGHSFSINHQPNFTHGTQLTYLLLLVDESGSILMAQEDISWGSEAAFPFELSAAPNPFNPQTRISFTLGKDEFITLRIYDLQGRLVNSLVDEFLGSGQHFIDWKGQDAQGGSVSSGRYFAILKTSDRTENIGLTLLR